MSERPQGPQEALFTEIFLQSSGAVQLTVLAQLTDPADPAELLAVLPAIHGRHPMLHGRAEQREATEWWWVFDVAFEDIDIRRVTIDDDFDTSDFYRSEASLTLDILSVNYRVTLLTRDSGVNWIALTVNHAAIDGRSSLNVLNEIDRALAEKPESDTSLPIPPSAEDGLATAGYSGHSDLLPPVPADAMWPVARSAASGDRRAGIVVRCLSARDVAGLHRQMHHQGLHLAAAFAAAIVPASRTFPGATGWTPMLATTDVRGDCSPPVPTETIGEYVGSITLLIKPDHQHDGPRQLTDLVSRQLTAGRRNALDMVEDYDLATLRAQAKTIGSPQDSFPHGICVSDVGDMSRLAGRQVGFDQVILMPAQRHGAHPLMVVIITTTTGAHLTVGYAEPLTSADTAANFADLYVAELRSLARAGHLL